MADIQKKDIFIVHNDLQVIIELSQMLDQLGGFHILGVCQDDKAVLPFLANHRPQLIIMGLGEQADGYRLDLAGIIRHFEIPIVFVTQQETAELYEATKAIPNQSFLVLPFHRFTLAATIDTLLRDKKEQATPQSGKLIYTKNGSRRDIINPENILWLESDRDYCTLHTNDKKLVIKTSLKKIKEQLPTEDFLQIHQSYIVRCDFLNRIDFKEQRVFLNNQQSLPLGRSYRKTLNHSLSKLG